MFYGCQSLKEINLSNFNTKNIDDISEIFDYISDSCTLICNDKIFVEQFNEFKNN